MKLFKSRTSDVLVFSDEAHTTDLEDMSNETIYEIEVNYETDLYYEVDDAMSWDNFLLYCEQNTLQASSGKVLVNYVKECEQ